MDTPHNVFRQVMADTGNWIAAIRIIRERFGLDLGQAKEVMLQAEGTAASLHEHQERLADSIPVSVLDAAAGCGQMHRVKAALNAGADVNEAGPFGTALHCAAENGHLEIARLLVEHGTDVQILDPIGRTARAAALQTG